jgi:hypothetical protein
MLTLLVESQLLQLYDQSHYNSVTPEEWYEQLFRSQRSIDAGEGITTDQQLIYRVDAIVRALGYVNCFNNWERTSLVFNARYRWRSPGTPCDAMSVSTADCFFCWTRNSLFHRVCSIAHFHS